MNIMNCFTDNFLLWNILFLKINIIDKMFVLQETGQLYVYVDPVNKIKCSFIHLPPVYYSLFYSMVYVMSHLISA